MTECPANTTHWREPGGVLRFEDRVLDRAAALARHNRPEERHYWTAIVNRVLMGLPVVLDRAHRVLGRHDAEDYAFQDLMDRYDNRGVCPYDPRNPERCAEGEVYVRGVGCIGGGQSKMTPYAKRAYAFFWWRCKVPR